MPADSTAKPSSNQVSKWKKATVIALRICKWAFAFGLVCGFFGAGLAFGYIGALVHDDPVRPKEEMMEKINENVITGFVYFNDDSLVGQLRTEEDRRLASVNEIPQVVKDAVLSIEDADFYKHHGIAIKGLFRALAERFTNAEVQTGASTITQQLARRVFLTLERTDKRKAKEIFLALRMERFLSKEQILLAYLNKIHFGNGSSGYNLYGIKAAAKGIFNIDDLSQLNVAQAAYLAGLPQQPAVFSAYTSKGEFNEEGFKRAMDRQKLVLKRMYEEGKLTESQYQEALQFDIRATLAQPQQKAYATYPYLMLEVERQAADILARLNNPDLNPDTKDYAEALKEARAQLLSKGYHIYTTIDKTIYDEMRAIAENDANFMPDDKTKGMEHVAAVMLDNKTGAILGMIEGRDFHKEQMNLATQMYRQPGSTMKTIGAYIPAIEKGAVAPATVIDDVPIILKDGTKGYHLPENWDGKFHGLVTARTALNQSYNIPAIRLFLEVVGIETAWDYAKKMGITSLTKEDYHAQTGVIGGLTRGVSVEELTNAYATIPNKGIFVDAFLIRKITDSEGKVVYEHKLQPSRVFSEETAYIITDMLRTVITSGTATDLKREFKYYNKVPVAGKTGSTQNDGDAWFIGFTPDITVGVWAGYDQPKHSLRTPGCSMNADPGCGTLRAKKIWAKVMNALVEKKPELLTTKSFERPANIVEMTVSAYSGKLPSEETVKANKLITDIFNKKYLPTEEDRVLVSQKVVTYDGRLYLANPSTPADMVQEKLVIKREKPIADIIKQIESILPSLPKDSRRDISHYYPLDYDSEAATEVDPRADDGRPPSPPGNVTLKRTGDLHEITFQPATEPDIVGYRLYRSVNGGNFQRLNGNVVLAGQEPKFTDTVTAAGVVQYLITAVDIVGNESPPSEIVRSVSSGGPFPFDPFGSPGIDTNGNTASGGTVPVPSAPVNVRIRSSGPGIEISWSANPANEAVTRYDVYYSESENGPFKKLASSDTTSVAYFSLNNEGWYYVVAVNKTGTSKPSKTVRFQN